MRTLARAATDRGASLLSGDFCCCARENSSEKQATKQTARIVATLAFEARGSVGALSIGVLLVIQSNLEHRSLTLLEAVVTLRVVDRNE